MFSIFDPLVIYFLLQLANNQQIQCNDFTPSLVFLFCPPRSKMWDSLILKKKLKGGQWCRKRKQIMKCSRSRQIVLDAGSKLLATAFCMIEGFWTSMTSRLAWSSSVFEEDQFLRSEQEVSTPALRKMWTRSGIRNKLLVIFGHTNAALTMLKVRDQSWSRICVHSQLKGKPFAWDFISWSWSKSVHSQAIRQLQSWLLMNRCRPATTCSTFLYRQCIPTQHNTHFLSYSTPALCRIDTRCLMWSLKKGFPSHRLA